MERHPDREDAEADPLLRRQLAALVSVCPSASETATDLVPAAFGTGYAVDRALLLGGQALAEAYGKARQTGNPYFWSEKELDHGDKLEILLGMIAGTSKIRFEIEHGDGKQFTDFGVMAIDTAVQLSA